VTKPHEYVATEALRNGLCVTIRAMRPTDRDRVATAVRNLDRDSIYLRLFSYRDELTPQALERIMRFDDEHEVVLLATIGAGDAESVVGSARYVVIEPGVAEVAFMVEEDYQGLGIGSRLLRHLATVARQQGIETFEADVLAANKSMQAVFARTGWPVSTRRDGDTVHVSVELPREGA
jgi:GNAT superfamily N-acetyltransferase